MLFNSFPFIIVFLPLALMGFYACAAIGTGAGKLWLVLASLAFYTYWHPPFTLLLLASVAFNYACGTLILGRRERGGKPILIFAVSANLLALFYYKYAYTLAASLVAAGITHELWMDRVLLPLGISFFTFTQIGFLIDCQSGEVKEKSPINYLLFVTFFPHLIAGPILHHREIMPQFADDAIYRPQPDNLARGAALFAIGLFKKVLLADQIAECARPGFADPTHLAFFGAWGAVLCYSLQLYFDFSGYSDMAIGIARMCNIRFPLNFNSPYKAANIIDFWQRWHMTLTRYLTLYLYNPMTLRATRRRVARGLPVSRSAMAHLPVFTALVALPMVVTMALAGIWHGAGLQFLIFGLLHGAYLTANHAWRIFGPKPRSKEAARAERPVRRRSRLLGSVLLTYLGVLIGQVFFRAESVAAAMTMVGGMMGLNGFSASMLVPSWLPAALGRAGTWLEGQGLIHAAGRFAQGGEALYHLALMAVLFAIVWLAPNSQQIVGLGGPARVAAPRPGAAPAWLRMSAGWGVATGLVAVAAILGIEAKSEFLYFQF